MENKYIHASELHAAVKCELRWTNNASEGGSQFYPVSAWIGSCVHARIAGLKEPTPEFMKFDKLTPSLTIARRQIEQIHEAIENYLKLNCFEIIDHELNYYQYRHESWPINMFLTGSADAYGKDSEGQTFLMDFKTGAAQDLQGYFLQMGAYRILDRYTHERETDNLIILHAPRPENILTLPKVVMHQSSCPDEVEDHVESLLHRLSDIYSNPALATACPGMYCKYCDYSDCGFKL